MSLSSGAPSSLDRSQSRPRESTGSHSSDWEIISLTRAVVTAFCCNQSRNSGGMEAIRLEWRSHAITVLIDNNGTVSSPRCGRNAAVIEFKQSVYSSLIGGKSALTAHSHSLTQAFLTGRSQVGTQEQDHPLGRKCLVPLGKHRAAMPAQSADQRSVQSLKSKRNAWP